LLIILLGFMLGAGGGIALAALLEGLDSSVKVSEEVERVWGLPVLATISFYDSPAQKRQRRMKRIVLATSIVAILLVGSLAVDRFVLPLDDLWAKFEDRLVEMGVPIEKKSANS
jgi:4-hydroxybenzoate polyprenyltransferase